MKRNLKYNIDTGFTLVELLIVIAVGALLTTLVAPRSFSMINQFNKRIEHYKTQELMNQTAYEAFIRQVSCSIFEKQDDTEMENEKVRIQMICGGELIEELKIGFAGEKTLLPIMYNSKGIKVKVQRMQVNHQ